MPSLSAAALRQVRHYDNTFVPTIFHPWACLLVGALAPESGTAGLDVGTGPGTVARVLAACLGITGSVVGIDTSAAMLALAQSKPPASGATVRYLETDAEHAGLPPASFDVVTCQQVLQFVPDLSGTLAELRRVTRPGGRLGILTWVGLDRNPLFAALHDAVEEVLGAASAAAFREPWSLAATATPSALAQAGFTDIQTGTRTLPAHFPGGLPQVRRFYAFCACSAEIDALDTAPRSALHQATKERLTAMTHQGAVHSYTTATLTMARA
jgi:SAM-dependent methyltransferase